MGTAVVLLALLADGGIVVEVVAVVLLVLGADSAPLAPVVGMKRTIVIDSCSSCWERVLRRSRRLGLNMKGCPSRCRPHSRPRGRMCHCRLHHRSIGHYSVF